MPVSKKARKKYVPKPVLRPLGMRNEFKTELPIQMAYEALGTDWFGMGQIAEFLVHAEVIRDGARDQPTRDLGLLILRICDSILAREKRTGKLGVSGDEMRTLRETLQVTIPYVRTIPNHVIYAVVSDNRKQKGLT